MLNERFNITPMRQLIWRFVDIETTGLSIKHGAEITEIAILSRTLDYYWSQELDEDSERNTILRFFIENTILVGHNIMFDLRFLMNEICHDSPIQMRFVDTVVLAKELGWALRLSKIITDFQLPLRPHNAVDDAQASRFVFDSYCEMFGFPRIQRMMREGNI